MRICFTCREFPLATQGGGIGTYTANLARALAERGHSVQVVTSAPAGTDADVVNYHGVLVHCVRAVPPPPIGHVLDGDGKSFAHALAYSAAIAKAVRRLAAEDAIEIVQSPEHGGEGLVLALGTPPLAHVVRFHTPLYMVNQAVGRRLSVGGKVVHYMEKVAARRATLNTTASLSLAREIAGRFRISLDKIRVIPNAIDHDVFRPAAKPKGAPPTLLYVGKIAPLKGAATLAAAVPIILRRIPNAQVLLVGSDHPGLGRDSSRTALQRAFTNAGVDGRVTFHHPVPRERLVSLYQQADAFLFPTLWDNFPNTCLEAMACGLPVVASAVGGLSEIICHGREGLLVPPGDAAALAEAAIQLLRDTDRRRQMGLAAREKVVTTFTSERVVASTLAAYQEAVERFGRLH